MKKILITVLMLMMVGVSVYACDCGCNNCPTRDPGINLFQAPSDKDAVTCPSVCGRVPGSLKYDGESLSVVCPCTGAGFDCTPPKGQKLIPWFLCDCDKFDELEVKEPLGLVIEILTPGVKFYTEAGINPETIKIYGFKTEEDYCDNEYSNLQELPFHFDDGARESILITNARRKLFKSGQLYLGICIPPLEIDQKIVPLNTVVKVRISIYRNKYICGVGCGAEVCPCVASVAFLGCFKCCTMSGYLPYADGWWAGVAITNISNSSSMVVVSFANAAMKKIKILTLAPNEVRSFTPDDLGFDLGGPFYVAAKATTNIKLVTFGGCAQGVYAVPGTSCGCE